MKATLTALTVGLSAIATGGPVYAGSINVADAIVVDTAATTDPTYVTKPDPRYIVYSYNATLPGPGCYWTRMPMYDSHHEVIGWRGRPQAVCPEPRVSAEAEQPKR